MLLLDHELHLQDVAEGHENVGYEWYGLVHTGKVLKINSQPPGTYSMANKTKFVWSPWRTTRPRPVHSLGNVAATAYEILSKVVCLKPQGTTADTPFWCQIDGGTNVAHRGRLSQASTRSRIREQA